MPESACQCKWTTLVLGAAVLLGCQPIAAQTLFADPGRNSGDAASGVAIYLQSCAAGHGGGVEGNAVGPALVGQVFLERWGQRSATELQT